MAGDHAWSPTRTKGATRCWFAATPLVMLLFCLRLASLDSEGGDSCIEHEVALMMIGRASSFSSSSSCCISWRLTAMASAAKEVSSLALLFLEGRQWGGAAVRARSAMGCRCLCSQPCPSCRGQSRCWALGCFRQDLFSCYCFSTKGLWFPSAP